MTGDFLRPFPDHPLRQSVKMKLRYAPATPSASLLLLLLVLAMSLLSGTQGVEELQIETTKKGDCSRVAKKGDVLKMHYAGSLEDGTEFDSSYTRGDPLAMTLGIGMVIKGWDDGLLGICKGEIRNLVIPPRLGYGDSGYPPVIPEKATLKFKVELIDFGEQEDLGMDFDDEDLDDEDDDDGDDDDDDDDDAQDANGQGEQDEL